MLQANILAAEQAVRGHGAQAVEVRRLELYNCFRNLCQCKRAQKNLINDHMLVVALERRTESDVDLRRE